MENQVRGVTNTSPLPSLCRGADARVQTFQIDEDVITSCLALNFPTRVTREQLVALLHRRESHPLRVAYDLILDHKNAKSRIDGP